MSSSSAPHSSNFDPRRLFVVYMRRLADFGVDIGPPIIITDYGW